ncbi:MAG: DUF87 domain-containing protein, partial [Candidatus Obscuribacterales bacterium]|nr:DUF87 domain-containing protein [Candidatus Obscuribacterales bacterium]
MKTRKTKTSAAKTVAAKTNTSRKAGSKSVKEIAECLLSLGTLSNAANRSVQLECNINALKNHVLICGSTGSGKTNTCFNLLEQLLRQKIPFLVIEPAKSEYRHLFMSSEMLKEAARIYTVSDNTASAFKINPFEILPGVNVQSHIDALLAIFRASFEMYSPMPQVLSRAICSLYESRGWDLVLSRNTRLPRDFNPTDPLPSGIFPTMQDLFESIDSVTESFGYSEQITPDVRA